MSICFSGTVGTRFLYHTSKIVYVSNTTGGNGLCPAYQRFSSHRIYIIDFIEGRQFLLYMLINLHQLFSYDFLARSSCIAHMFTIHTDIIQQCLLLILLSLSVDERSPCVLVVHALNRPYLSKNTWF